MLVSDKESFQFVESHHCNATFALPLVGVQERMVLACSVGISGCLPKRWIFGGRNAPSEKYTFNLKISLTPCIELCGARSCVCRVLVRSPCYSQETSVDTSPFSIIKPDKLGHFLLLKL